MQLGLNERAWELLREIERRESELRVRVRRLKCRTKVYDFGIETRGGLEAGRLLAEICLAGLGNVAVQNGEFAGRGWPHVTVWSDHPVEACLASQYAGWQISVAKYFAMGSGPMRATAAHEELFARLGIAESSEVCVGVLEAGQLPTEDACREIAEKCGVDVGNLALAVAPTSSLAGNLQVVARSVETALHKLHELGWDVSRVQCGFGTAPLPPVAADDLTGIGRTNDAILYGGRVSLWVTGDDVTIAEVGPHVPAEASPVSGKPFLEVFEEAGRDFYKIDPHLFSPAEITIHNLDTGTVATFGSVNPAVLEASFGL